MPRSHLTLKANPFKPNSPVNPGMFVGRGREVALLESHLAQAASGNPTHFMITGERGIGKTSLLNYFKWVAEGQVALGNVEHDLRLKFLVVDIDIDPTTTQLGLIRKIELSLRRQLARSEPARHFLSEAWSFLSRIEAGGFKLNQSGDDAESLDEVVFEEFSYSLKDVADRLVSSDNDGPFAASYTGIILLVDEADNASRSLRLGTFCKLLLERLERRGCSCVMVGLAGLSHLRSTLASDHASSVRLFEELPLSRLTEEEVNEVVDRCLRAASDSERQITMDAEARSLLAMLSEGYPHFIQQFGYSAFAADTDDVISKTDVAVGAFGTRGAMEQIGDRYYRDAFYNKIQEEQYRQVLRIMADRLDGWITKQEIRRRFRGSDQTLDNAIKALRDRKIIFSKEGARGVYRLQHKGFAWWIKLYNSDPSALTGVAADRPSEQQPAFETVESSES